LPDEAAGGQFVDHHAIHLFVEIEIEGVERAIGIAETRLLGDASFSMRTEIRDQRGHSRGTRG